MHKILRESCSNRLHIVVLFHGAPMDVLLNGRCRKTSRVSVTQGPDSRSSDGRIRPSRVNTNEEIRPTASLSNRNSSAHRRYLRGSAAICRSGRERSGDAGMPGLPEAAVIDSRLRMSRRHTFHLTHYVIKESDRI